VLTREGVAKLTDFGIARAVDTAKLTRTGTALGTPAYMSPEQIQGAKLDHRTDIYSLGVVLYEMLTGRVPFERPGDADNDFAVLEAHIHQEPAPPSQLVPEIPPFLDNAILKALEKRPEDRFASCQEFQAALVLPALPPTVVVEVRQQEAPARKPVDLSDQSSEPGRYRRPAPRIRENPKDGLKYVWIPPGTFMMGCSPGDRGCNDNETPSHRVAISKGFWMGQTEVTVGAFRRFRSSYGMPPPPRFDPGWANDDMPIINVSWDDARDWCRWAGGRLPTEAEWEYAARGGSTEARYGNIDRIAWHRNNSGNRAHVAAGKEANGFGLFDVLGNVWEWVNDWYDDKYYQNGPTQDPPGPASGQHRVLRGGSWYYSPDLLRVSARTGAYPLALSDNIGFRCVWEVE
jgi:formylglycine-generating enzyme required for sulfatase activity